LTPTELYGIIVDMQISTLTDEEFLKQLSSSVTIDPRWSEVVSRLEKDRRIMIDEPVPANVRTTIYGRFKGQIHFKKRDNGTLIWLDAEWVP
jgi:hypothetical protein